MMNASRNFPPNNMDTARTVPPLRCLEELDLRVIKIKFVIKAFPALWAILDPSFDKTQYLSNQVSKIELELLFIRSQIFENAPKHPTPVIFFGHILQQTIHTVLPNYAIVEISQQVQNEPAGV